MFKIFKLTAFFAIFNCISVASNASQATPNAYFGTIEEVVNAGKNNVEPAYVSDLLTSLRQRIIDWEAKNPLDTPMRRVVFYGAVNEILQKFLYQIRVHGNQMTLYSARASEEGTYEYMVYQTDTKKAEKVAKNLFGTLWRPSNTKIHLEIEKLTRANGHLGFPITLRDEAERHARGMEKEVGYRVSYRVSQWRLLNLMNQEMLNLLNYFMENSNPDPETNDLSAFVQDAGNWEIHWETHFQNLDPEIRRYFDAGLGALSAHFRQTAQSNTDSENLPLVSRCVDEEQT